MSLATMLSFAQVLGLTFVPILIALDSIGNLPIILSWTAGLSEKEMKLTLRQALLTALGVGLVFVLAGRAVFLLLGITINDFLIAGGLVLLVLAIMDLVSSTPRESSGIPPGQKFGVVPIGTPLLAGPATLTTILILSETYGLLPTAVSYILNLLLAWYLYENAARLTSLLGTAGLKAASKVVSLLLAAIAIKIVRQGLAAMLGGFLP
ncbi:MAG: MarC family protein [Chloroflexi bacterium]|nr:MarC family protein [Chloroflexota bacterium]